MPRHTIRFSTALATALLVQVSPGLPAFARTTQPAVNQTASNQIYRKAQKEMDPEVYSVYRVIDKLARANNQDSLPWRIAIVDKYDVNAFASSNNHIAVYTGLLDQIHGDTAALACVVAHEMGHHVARHISKQLAYEAMTTGIANKKLESQIRSNMAQVKVSEIAAGLLGRAFGTNLPSLIGGLMINRKSPEELKMQKEQELQLRIAQFSQNQEYEADAYSYRYMATAGYDPQGCLRVMEVLARGNGAEFETTHPVVRKRVEQIQRLIKEEPASALAQQGISRLSSSTALTYSRSLDRTSVRVNSRIASAAVRTGSSGWTY